MPKLSINLPKTKKNSGSASGNYGRPDPSAEYAAAQAGVSYSSTLNNPPPGYTPNGVAVSPEARAAAIETLQAMAAKAEQQKLLRDKRLKDAAAKKKDSPGFLGRLKGIGAAFIDVLDKPIEELVRQPLYSAQRTKTLGGSNLEGAQGFVAGLPGLGFVAGKAKPVPQKQLDLTSPDPFVRAKDPKSANIVRQAVEETNSRQERAILTDAGKLQSTGQAIAGKAKFPEIPLWVGGRTVNINPLAGKSVSGAIDLTIELGADPFNVLGAAAVKFAKVGEKAGARGVRLAEKAGVNLDNVDAVVAAERQGRAVFLESTQGKQILTAAVDATKEVRDPAALSKAVKGLSATDATKVLDAAKTGTTSEVRDALARTFIEATWNPHIPVLRQATHLGVGRAAAPKGLGLTRWADNLLRGDGAGFATGTSKEAGATLARTAQRAGMAAGKFASDLRPTETLGMPIAERVDRLRGLVDNSDNAAFQDVVSEELGRVLASGTNAEADRLLARMEVVEAALSGQAGDAARIQAQAELSQGALLKKTAGDPVAELHRAAEGRGVAPKAPLPFSFSVTSKKGLQHVDNLLHQLPPEWEIPLRENWNRAVQTRKGMTKAAKDIQLAMDPDVATDAYRRVLNVGERGLQNVAPDVVKPGLGQRVSKGAARRILDAQESIAPGSIPFTASRHAGLATVLRVEGADRWAKAVDLDRTARAALREALTAAQTEEEVFAAIENGLTLLAARNGVDPDDLIALYRAARADAAGAKSSTATGIDEGGKVVRDHEFVASQLVHDLKLPDVADVKKSIKILKQGGDTDLALALSEAKGGLSGSGLIRLLKKGHHVWKFQIVSNAYAPVIGGVGGFAFGGGSLEERSKRGLIGAAIGLFGPLRYVVRVGLIEERILRYSLARPGVKTLPEYIPFLARHWAERGVTIPFVDEHLVTAQGRLDSIVGTKLSTLGEDWVAMGQKDPRFLEGWSRIVNYQIHPESDEVSRIFLNVKAGTMTLDEGIVAATDFLKNTVDGQILRKRLAGGIGGTSNIDEILARYQHFIDSNTTAKIAQTRLDAANHGVQVDKAVLKGELKAGLGPQKVHAQKTWVIPKSYTQVKATANKLLKDLVFEGPTSATRTAMARAEYGDEFRRLVRAGVPEEEAAANASEFAVRRTNEVMFQISDESRMAKKLDYIAPFQQPREELLRVWGKMIKNNPFQAMKMTREGALIFNNGQDSGMFRRDPFGNYVMTVPGSGQLSQALTGVNSNLDFNLKDTLFFTQGAFGQELGVGINFVPVPGGPWWTVASKAWATSFPDAYKDMPDNVKGLLFPYGVSGTLTTGPGRRLWMYATGSLPPWEFASQQDQQDSHNRMMLEMAAQLRYQHMQNTGDPNYIPSEEEVEKALRSYYGFWAFASSVSPAAPQPVFPGQKEFEAVQNAYRDPAKGFYPDGQARVDWTKLVDENPVMDFYLQKSTNGNKYVGPDDFKHWTEQDEDKSEQYQLHLRERLDYDTFTDQFKQHQKDSLAWTEWKNILNTPSSLQNTYVKEALLVDWRARNPHLAQGSMTSYVRDAELADILRYPQSVQNVRIDDWRKTHNVSHKQFVAIKADIDKNGFKEEPWRRARYSEDVFRDVAKQITLGGQEETIVSTLLPAEQVNYWKFKISQLSYYDGSPQNPLEQERQKDLWQKYTREIYNAHPELRGGEKKLSPWEQALEDYKGPIRDQISAGYEEIARIAPTLQELAQTKQWTAYYQLKDKQSALYDEIAALKNKMYQSVPNVPEWQQDIAAVMLHNGDFKGLFDLPGIRTEYGIDFVPSDEEASYLGLPIGLQRNTVEQLRLMLTEGDARIGDNGAYVSKLQWSYLTDFQKSLLERNLPADLIDDIRGGVYAAATGGSSGGGGGGYSKSGGGGGSGNAELDYAYELFAQYNRRPEGATAPAAYADYLALPANPALRADFIKKNPDVAEWIKLGPMSNMNDIERYIVSNIMIKYGKWEGEEKSMTEITDLAFAREQLKRFNMRGTSTRPEAYDNWLNMPSGIEKALYIKQHPEIGDWIRLGPMANMPEEYQTVVRDIMMRYGEWSNQQDALGDTIAEYYKIPSFAREQYLEDHPELVEYWRAIRTPEEQRKFAMADQYFSIQDNRAKRAYLMSNPELQQFFLDQRTKRYEKFLNQVAQFMGQNPEMFEGYLTRQSDILAEMYRRYSSPSLMNEVHVVKSQSTGTKRTAPKQRTRAA